MITHVSLCLRQAQDIACKQAVPLCLNRQHLLCCAPTGQSRHPLLASAQLGMERCFQLCCVVTVLASGVIPVFQQIWDFISHYCL